MSNTYDSDLWSVDLPPGWQVREHEICTSFFREDGVGALQVGAFLHEYQEITDPDLLEINEEAGNEDAPVLAFSSDHFKGFSTRFSTEEAHWGRWLLRAGRLLVHVTYNCNLENAGVEDHEVYEIVMTFRPAEDLTIYEDS